MGYPVKFLALLWVNDAGYVLVKWQVLVFFQDFTYGVSTELLHTSSGRLPVWPTTPQASCVTNTARASVTACNCYHKRFLTNRQRVIHDRYFANIGCHYLFPTQGHTGLDTHTAWQLYTTRIPHTISAQSSPCNFSALCYLLRLLSFTADSEPTQKSQYTDCIS